MSDRPRRHYNTVRAHSSLNYSPPAPGAKVWPRQNDRLQRQQRRTDQACTNIKPGSLNGGRPIGGKVNFPSSVNARLNIPEYGLLLCLELANLASQKGTALLQNYGGRTVNLLRLLFGKDRLQTEYEYLVSKVSAMSNSERGELLALVTDARNQFEDLYGWNFLETVAAADVDEIVSKINLLRDVAANIQNLLARDALEVWYFTAQANRSKEFKYLTNLLWLELQRGIPFCEPARQRLSERGTTLNIDRFERKPPV